MNSDPKPATVRGVPQAQDQSSTAAECDSPGTGPTPASETRVENIHDFLREYGTLTPRIMVERLIEYVPTGHGELIATVRMMLQDLKVALEHVR